MSAPSGRILRVGIVHDNRILEERLLRKPGRVTIGQAPENTFVYPLPGFPRSFELLSYANGSYAFVFPQGLAGRVSSGDEILDLAEVVQNGAATRVGAFYRYALADDSRGKVRLGDLTVLFQFVTTPPPVPRLQLPAAARVGWFQRLDLAFASVLTISFLALAAPAVTLHAWYEARGKYLVTRAGASRVIAALESEVELRQQRPKKAQTIDVNFSEPLRSEPSPEPPPPRIAPSATTATRAAARPSSGPSHGAAEGEGEKKPYKKTVENITDITLLKFLAPGDGSSGGPVIAGVQADRLADAWSFARGAETAQENDVVGFRGTPKLATYVDGPPRPPRRGPIAVRDLAPPVKAHEIIIKPMIRGLTGDQIGPGAIDKSSVADVFKRRQGALRHCYEKRLKLNPDLAGRIRVMFTIGPAGRTTAVSIPDNSSGDLELGRCISDRIREWPFPRPRGGAVTFVHTLVLTSG